MAISSDFSVAANGDIRHVSGTTHYTVIELHRWLGDLMDDAQASGNDLLDITDATASERATDNLITLNSPYNVDDTAVQYLYDGSIVQKGGDEIYDGIVVIAAQGMYLQVIQDGALVTNFWTNGYNADAAAGYSHRFMLKVRTAGADIDGRRLIFTTREWGKTYSEFRIGTGTARGNNVAALAYQDDLNNLTAVGTVAGWTEITNVTEGYKLLQVDPPTAAAAYYSEWNKHTYTINQFYERMKWLTRRDSTSTLYGLDGDLFRGITHEISLTTPRSGTWGTPEHEVVTWSGGTGRLLAIDNKTGSASTKMWIQLLTGVPPTNTQAIAGQTSGASAVCSGTPTERLPIPTPFIGVSTGAAIIGAYGVGMETADLSNLDKLFDLTNTQHTPPNQVQFSVSGLNTANGGDRVLVGPLGYYVQYDNEGGTSVFARGDSLSWSSPNGTGYLSELLDLGTTGFMKIRLTSGSPPIDNSPITNGSRTCDAFGPAVYSEDPRQLKLATTLNASGQTSIVCTAAIPTDTPASGSVRVQLDSGIYRRVDYTSYSGTTFTTASTDWSGANAATGGAGETGNSIFVSYIDKNAGASAENFTSVYSANRDLFVRVRFGYSGAPIKTFESSAQLSGAGGSTSAIRTTDA